MSGNLGYAMAVDSELSDSEVPNIAFDIELGDDFTIGGAVGYSFGNTRPEGEIAYQLNDMEKLSSGLASIDIEGDTSSLALLLNGYYDYKNTSAFTPLY